MPSLAESRVASVSVAPLLAAVSDEPSGLSEALALTCEPASAAIASSSYLILMGTGAIIQ